MIYDIFENNAIGFCIIDAVHDVRWNTYRYWNHHSFNIQANTFTNRELTYTMQALHDTRDMQFSYLLHVCSIFFV